MDDDFEEIDATNNTPIKPYAKCCLGAGPCSDCCARREPTVEDKHHKDNWLPMARLIALALSL